MNFSDPTSDVIRKSILTNQGDIVVRGVSQPERLGIGSTGQILQVNATENSLEYVNNSDFSMIGYQLLTSSINFNSGMPTIFTSDNYNVYEGEIYEITTRLSYNVTSNAWVLMVIEEGANHTAGVSEDGVLYFGEGFQYKLTISNYATGISQRIIRLRCYITSDGIFQYIVKASSNGASASMLANFCTTYMIKLK